MEKSKPASGQERFYRKFYNFDDLLHFNVRLGETDLDIGAQRVLKREAMELVRLYRRHIEEYIRENPEFLRSLKPIALHDNAPPIIRSMIEAGYKANVGPMAAVAGAISQYVGEGLSEFSREIIVENGGDIYIKSSRERIIGIYAGQSPLSGKIGLIIDPSTCPMGICTSSGRVGHSLSFGRAHGVVVLSGDTALADAAATATCNMVKTVDDIQYAIDMAREIEGVTGVVVIMEDRLGSWGDISLTRL